MTKTLLLLVQVALALADTDTCYWPNSKTAPAAKVCPKAKGKEYAACCFKDHYCLENGLCWSWTDSSMYRGACTDPNFNGEGCPRFCLDNEQGARIEGSAVWACHNEKKPANYVCGTTKNCNNMSRFVEVEHPAKVMWNSALELNLGVAATTTSSDTLPSCSAAATQERSGISVGAAAGIGVGIGLPLVLAVGVLGVMLMRERKKVADTTTATTTAEGDPKHGPPPAWTAGTPAPSELPSAQPTRHEM